MEAEQIAFGDLERRLDPPRTRDEIAALVETLNRMLDRIDAGARSQRAFIGDASHELRTPIATLRTQLEVALAHPERSDWPRVAAKARDEVERMQRLVEDLLRIARLDDAPRDLRGDASVDLEEIVLAECSALGAPVDCSHVLPARVRGREADLRRVVRNLLENAQRYGAGRIAVRLECDRAFARLSIEDDGPGIPSHERSRVFDRFTRLEDSRSRQGGGAGLGLALCRGLVEAHEGQIEIERAELGGARFVVTLPLALPPT